MSSHKSRRMRSAGKTKMNGRIRFFFTLTLLLSSELHSQAFTNINIPLAGVSASKADWIDYDGDGDLDLFVLTSKEGILVKDTLGSFTVRVLSVPAFSWDQFAWEDYDNDGDLDLILSAPDQMTVQSGGEMGVRLYENKGHDHFQYRRLPISYASNRGSAWCDFDNDGDLDFFFFGAWPSAFDNAACIWRNDGNDVFTQMPSFGSMHIVSFCIGDFNLDGWKDIIIAGDGFQTTMLVNCGKMAFTQVITAIPALTYGQTLQSADLNDDGYQDVIICGETKNVIYRNSGPGTSFSDVGASIGGMRYASALCGDYDNDGKLDLLIRGYNTTDSIITKLYHNGGNFVFSEAAISSPNSASGCHAWGDYDNDGDLDLLGTGSNDSSAAWILRNDGATANTRPVAPSLLQAVASGDSITLSWNAGSDIEMSPSGLTYAVRAGRSYGGSELLSCLSNMSSGQRLVARPGNVLANKSLTLHGIDNGTYYWSVQSIDNCYAGSLFAGEQTITVSTSGNESYTAIHPAITGITWGATVWGDYDGDGDLDVVVTGSTEGTTSSYRRITRIYRNDGGTFTDIQANLPGLNYSAAAWGDYDNDGDLDLAVTGMVGDNSNAAKIYRNDGNGVFTDIQAPLQGLMWGAVAWGDYDGDGLLDLALCGESSYGSSGAVCVYHNLGNGNFTALEQSVRTVDGSTLAWGDYDNDGDLDLAVGCGQRAGTRLLHNDGDNAFTDLQLEFSEEKDWKQGGPVVWCDFDADGDLDLLAERTIYINTNGIFSAGPVLDMRDVGIHSTSVCDMDNNGYPDILMTGVINGTQQNALRCFSNGGNLNFRTAVLTINGTNRGTISAGDFDHDGDMDIMLSGALETGSYICEIFRRSGSRNTLPSNPLSLTSSFQNGKVHFAWTPGSDAETPANGLTYNVRIGSTVASQDIRSSQADLASGWLFVPAMGNAQSRLWAEFVGSESGTYYWSVQTIDQGYAGSTFADVQTFHLEAILRVSMDTLDFGKIIEGEHKAITFYIGNDGNIPLILRSLSIPDPAFAITSLSNTIQPGDSSAITVTFRPISGARHDTSLTIEHNALSGKTVLPMKAAMLEITPRVSIDAVDFGVVMVGEEKACTFYLRNDGMAPLIIRALSISDPSYSIVSSSDTIQMGDSSTITVTLMSTTQANHNAFLTIDHNGLPGRIILSIKAVVKEVPTRFELSQNFPNPFNSGTRFIVSIPTPCKVTIEICDLTGRQIAILLDDILPIGYRTIQWNATGLASGVYFYRLHSDFFTESKKLLYVK